jgi:hypothetical protein
MKDKNGIDLVEGDLVILSIDTPIDHPAQKVVFKNQVERTISISQDGEERTKKVCDINYYPISDEGLEVVKKDAGQTQALLHREEEYKATNIKPRHLIKLNTGTLRGYEKTLYDSIVALL